jgi:riboflavin kinase/FMN adenylyltransferase
MLLTTIEEKEKFVPDFLEGKVIVLDFNEELRRLSAEEFVKKILVDGVGVKKVIVGYDHAFGKNRSGNITELKRLGQKYGFDVTVVDPIIVEGKPVSSSRIRKAMLGGHFTEAIRLLGHEYAIYGTVERGIGLGRKIGYPTANVHYSPRKLLPPPGVYACWAQTGNNDKYGMMFIGQNHFNPVERVTVEANLFAFDRDIYDDEIIVYPCKFIRDNLKFDSTEELVKQIETDKQSIIKLMNTGEKACP